MRMITSLRLLVRKVLSRLGYRLVRQRDRGLLPDDEYNRIKSAIIRQFIDVRIPEPDDELHSSVSSKVIFSYHDALETTHNPVYNPSVLWNDLYGRSPYLAESASERLLAAGLFLGARCDWLEGTGPQALVESWLRQPENFERNVVAAIRGRSFLRGRWLKAGYDSGLINRIFDAGQPIKIEYGEEIVGDCDQFWFYLTRIKEFFEPAAKDRVICLDLGGGNGRFLWAFKNLFPNSTVVSCDLPETLLGASYRLSMYFPQRRHLYFSRKSVREDLKDIASFDFVHIPSFAMGELPPACLDLVVNTNSLSEMRPETIGNYISIIGEKLKPGGVFYTVNRSVPKPNRAHVDVPLGEFPISESTFETLSYDDRFTDMDVFYRLGSVQVGEAAYRKRQ